MSDIPVIQVFQRALPETRTLERSCAWEARCGVGGIDYVAVSRGGATRELARTLIKAGIPHGARLVVRTEGRSGEMTTPGLVEWGRWTHSGARQVLWVVAQAAKARLAALRDGGCDG